MRRTSLLHSKNQQSVGPKIQFMTVLLYFCYSTSHHLLLLHYRHLWPQLLLISTFNQDFKVPLSNDCPQFEFPLWFIPVVGRCGTRNQSVDKREKLFNANLWTVITLVEQVVYRLYLVLTGVAVSSDTG